MKPTSEMKDGYYSIGDGVATLKEEFQNDKKASEILKKMEELSAKLYDHMGGV